MSVFWHFTWNISVHKWNALVCVQSVNTNPTQSFREHTTFSQHKQTKNQHKIYYVLVIWRWAFNGFAFKQISARMVLVVCFWKSVNKNRTSHTFWMNRPVEKRVMQENLHRTLHFIHISALHAYSVCVLCAAHTAIRDWQKKWNYTVFFIFLLY